MSNLDIQELEFLFECVYISTFNEETSLHLEKECGLNSKQIENVSIALRQKIAHELQKKCLS